MIASLPGAVSRDRAVTKQSESSYPEFAEWALMPWAGHTVFPTPAAHLEHLGSFQYGSAWASPSLGVGHGHLLFLKPRWSDVQPWLGTTVLEVVRLELGLERWTECGKGRWKDTW